MPGLVGAGAAVALVGTTIFGFSQGWFAKTAPTEDVDVADAEIADSGVLGAEQTIPAPNPDIFGDIPTSEGYDDPTGAADQAPDAEAAVNEDTPGAEDSGATAGEAAAPAPSAPAGKHPDSIDLTQYGPFERVVGTSDEDFAELEKQADYLFDLYSGKKGAQAKNRLSEAGKPALPSILNRFLELDLANDEHVEVGLQIAALLDKLVPRGATGWREGSSLANQYFNKRVIEIWAKRWTRGLTDPAEWEKFMPPPEDS